MSLRLKCVLAFTGVAMCIFGLTRAFSYVTPPPAPRPQRTVTLNLSTYEIILPAECAPDEYPAESCTATPLTIQGSALTRNFDSGGLEFIFTSTGGRIVNEGPNVTWDLSGVQPGTYRATVTVRDRKGRTASDSKTISVQRCQCNKRPLPCATVTTSCPTSVLAGERAEVVANVSDAGPDAAFNWSVAPQTPFNGQGTSVISINTTGKGGQSISATVDVGGQGPGCGHSSSCTFSVRKRND